MPFVDADYDTENWFARAKGMEWSPSAAPAAPCASTCASSAPRSMPHENGFPVITSSLGISRWKNMAQINDCGERAAGRYDGLSYWTYNWRKGGGSPA